MPVIDDIEVEDWKDHVAAARRRLEELGAKAGDTVAVRLPDNSCVAHVTKNPQPGGRDQIVATTMSRSS